MTNKEAKEIGYTHIGKLYKVPVYFTKDEQTHVRGTNWFNEKLLSFFIWFDINFTNNEAFAIEDNGEL